MKITRTLVTAALTLGVLSVSSPAQAHPAFPSSMAATGDSITRAFNVDAAHLLADDPARSWVTGTDPAVNSQYQRLLRVDPVLVGHSFNDSRTGASMADLDGQLLQAAAQRVRYATVLIGANDICTTSIATMTRTALFRRQFRTAMRHFTAADPAATVFVSSIPNLLRLWATLHTDPRARAVWAASRICPSMLAATNTPAQRRRVLAQENADNRALAAVCRQFRRCWWDGLATYRTRFHSGDVSTVDFFHPSVAGQHRLAAVSWEAGPWDRDHHDRDDQDRDRQDRDGEHRIGQDRT